MYLVEGSQIPYLSENDIALRVKELLDECWDGSFPIDIESICDYYNIAIVPIADFAKKLGVDAFISADFRRIYVDESEYRHNSSRYRFSVAHELGHYVLHKEYYSSRVESIEEWKGLACGSVNRVAEFQANCFAGNFLVPESELIKIVNNEFDGSFVRNYWYTSREKAKRKLINSSWHFKVSGQVMSRRMRKIFLGFDSFDIY